MGRNVVKKKAGDEDICSIIYVHIVRLQWPLFVLLRNG